MRTQMMMALQNCEKCKIYEKKDPKAPLCTVTATEPMDLVHIDLVGMEVTVETKKKPVVQKILVVTDHFSRFVQAYKVKDKRAITIAKCLYDNYFRHYGFPWHLLSDQGTEFCNTVLNEMCIYLNIKKLRTSPYHPQTNGAVDIFNETIIHYLAAQVDEEDAGDSTGEIPDDDKNDDDVDEDIQQTMSYSVRHVQVKFIERPTSTPGKPAFHIMNTSFSHNLEYSSIQISQGSIREVQNAGGIMA